MGYKIILLRDFPYLLYLTHIYSDTQNNSGLIERLLHFNGLDLLFTGDSIRFGLLFARDPRRLGLIFVLDFRRVLDLTSGVLPIAIEPQLHGYNSLRRVVFSMNDKRRLFNYTIHRITQIVKWHGFGTYFLDYLFVKALKKIELLLNLKFIAKE